MTIKAVYPGSFDPVTNGHLDIISRASKVFDQVIVGVLHNVNKQPLFSAAERVELLEQVTAPFENVRIECFDGLLIDFMRKRRATTIVKGLRAVSDFEAELQMASMNRKLDKSVETFFMMTNYKYSYLSSSIVKEISRHGASVQDLVPDVVQRALYDKFSTWS